MKKLSLSLQFFYLQSFFVVNFSTDSPVLKYKEMLLATLFTFLLNMNSAVCCAAVDCLMALVDLTGLMDEKEASDTFK